MTHLNVISCGQGAPSLFMIALAGQQRINADLVVVADTGWENDMLWNTGERTTAGEFFEQVTKPFAEEMGLDAVFVRTQDENGNSYESIPEAMIRKHAMAGQPVPEGRRFKSKTISKNYGLDIPLFGSNGGRLTQACTGKWKVQAINQESRRRGADTVTTMLGIHLGEIRRLKPSLEAWRRNAYPLVDLMQGESGGVIGMGIGRRWDRASVELELSTFGVPWLVTTQCDGCPHNDLARWMRHTPEVIDQIASLEMEVGRGEFFFTDQRIPLKEALEIMKHKKDKGTQSDMFDECGGVCGVG